MRSFAIITIALCGLAGGAHADDDARSIGHVVTAPTAWLPTMLTATAGGELNDPKKGPTASLQIPLGGLAAVELDDDTDVRTCDDCTATGTRTAIHLRRAAFRLGIRPDRYFRHQPAAVVGFRKSWRGTDDARVAELWVALSEELGPVRLHGGAMLTSADSAKVPLLDHKPSAFGGLEWTPTQYPRTSLVGDLVWVPELAASPKLTYVIGVAARYQAFSWGSLELGVRTYEGDAIGDVKVFVKMNLLAR